MNEVTELSTVSAVDLGAGRGSDRLARAAAAALIPVISTMWICAPAVIIALYRAVL